MSNMNTEGLLIIERLVMESLTRGAKNIDELSNDTRLSLPLLSHIIPTLIEKKIIINLKNSYVLNHQDTSWKQEVLKLANIQNEVRELVVAMINDYFQDKEVEKNSRDQNKVFKMQKVNFTQDEEKIFLAHLKSLESFISGVREQRKKEKSPSYTHAQRVVFWGSSKYHEIVNSMLEAI